MLKPIAFFIVVVVVSSITLLPHVAAAAIVNLRDAPFSAAGDGAADDRPALAKALAALKPGDVLLVPPGDYRIVLTKDRLSIPAGVTLWGQAGKSTFVLHSDGGTDDYRSFLGFGSNVTLDGISIERAADFPAVLLPIFGDLANVALRNCIIIGNDDRFPDRYCHAVQIGNGKLKGLTLDGTIIRSCTFGLFQANDATGTTADVTVQRCLFERNTASDLEFNAPKGAIRNVVVRDCHFRDNLCKNPSAGFAVGFANVTGGVVENCDIRRYGSEALHVEDRSTDIRLTGNTIVGGSMLQPNGVILVVNNSKQVTIEGNTIDARPNENKPHLILVTAGGDKFANPSDVAVKNNVLIQGPETRKWYLQPGSGPPPEGNVVVPAVSTADDRL